MTKLPHINLRRRAPAIGLLCLYAYLAFHAFSGSQGLLSWMSYSDEAARLEVRLSDARAQREALEADVDALSADTLDLDALEITARRKLFISDTKEITIYLDPQGTR